MVARGSSGEKESNFPNAFILRTKQIFAELEFEDECLRITKDPWLANAI